MTIYGKKFFFIAPLGAVLAACIILGLWQVLKPRPDEDSPAWQRMMDNLSVMAVEPHPAGSAEIEEVREKLLLEIEGWA